jgi:hypothetical protein
MQLPNTFVEVAIGHEAAWCNRISLVDEDDRGGLLVRIILGFANVVPEFARLMRYDGSE